MKLIKKIGIGLCVALTAVVGTELSFSPVQSEAEAQAKTLTELLNRVRSGAARDRSEQQARIARFQQARNQQQALLNQVRADVAAQEARSEQLESTFNANEEVLTELELRLQERLGEYAELFGTARQVAGDTRGQVQQSLVSAQFPGRDAALDEIASSKDLPTMNQLDGLFQTLLQEMTEQGKVARFKAPVVDRNGNAKEEDVTRVGPFTAVAKNRFVIYNAETSELRFLVRQPGNEARAAASRLDDAKPGRIIKAAIDPSSGAILGLLVQTPNLRERIDQGGLVGYVVIALAAVGMLIGFERLFTLSMTHGAVRGAAKRRKASKGNPLGRVFMAYEENQHADVETLELKLDDAILKEVPKLERGMNTLKVLAAVAPMLGLLGTVVGMIQTFQAITLFGTGDPKLMAGGISQALVTTVLGLVAAIPLLLLHSFASGRARQVQQVLEEQSAGLIAERAEGA